MFKKLLFILLISTFCFAQDQSTQEASIINDDNLGKIDVPLTGAWISDGGVSDQANFSDITNFRYTDKGLKVVDGYQRINYNTPVSSYPYIKSLYQYRSSGATDYSILLAQADDGSNNSVIIQNNSTVPFVTSGEDAFISYAEKITNGTLEDSGGWDSYGSPTLGGASADDYYTGTRSYKLIADSSGDGFQTHSDSYFSISADVVYDLVFWVKAPSNFVVMITDSTGASYAMRPKNVDISTVGITSEWSKVEYSFISNTTFASAKIVFYVLAAGTYYFDDITLSAAYLLGSTVTTTGVFSSGPNGSVLYSSGYNNYIWYGMESNVAQFYTTDSGTTTSLVDLKDWTDEVQNESSDAFNVAYVGQEDSSSNVILMLHLDNDVADEMTPAKTVTKQGHADNSSDAQKFGGYSAKFDGTGDYLNIADDDDFDFGTTWQIEMYVMFTSLDGDAYLYKQTDGSKYVVLYYDASSMTCKFIYYNGAINKIEVTTYSNYWVPIKNKWYNLVVNQRVSGGNGIYEIYVDGGLKGGAGSSSPENIPNIAGDITIGGYSGCTDGLKGYIDEVRIINADYSIFHYESPNTGYQSYESQYYGYSDGAENGTIYIGTIFPAQAFKFYVPNYDWNFTTGFDGTLYMSAEYSNATGDGWTSVPVVTDNTTYFTDTGWLTIPSSYVDLAERRTINGLNLYWYKFNVEAPLRQIYAVRAFSPFQEVNNIWDGDYDVTAEAKVWINSANTFYDYSDQMNSEVTTDIMDLSGITSSDYFTVSFADRMAGVRVYFSDDNINTTASTTLSVYYNDGNTWIPVYNMIDGTSSNSVSFAKSGTIAWQSPSKVVEKRYVDDYGQLFYKYRFKFDKTLSTSVKPYYIEGILYVEEPPASKFPLNFNHRAVLCNLSDGPADILISATNAPHIYNGVDSGRYRIGGVGEEIVSGTAFTVRYDSELYDLALFHKKGETWRLVGTSPSDYKISRLSDKIGCVAPKTIDTIQISDGSTIAMWLSSQGVVMSDGSNISIMKGIERYFDKTKPETLLNFSYASGAVGFFDPDKYEYNIQFPRGSSTTNNTWLVYDILKSKWFKKDSPQYFRSATTVQDSTGAQYVYGGMSDGYVVRNEYGNAWIDPSMSSNCKACAITGNIKLNETSLGSLWNEARIKFIKVRGKNLPKRVNYDDDLSITEVDASSKLTIASATDQTFTFTDVGGSASAYAYSRPSGISTNYGYANWGEWAYTLKLNLSSVTTSDTAYVFGLCESNAADFLTNVDTSNKAGYGIKFLGTASGVYSLYFEHWSGGSAVQLGTNSITGLAQGTDYYIAIVKQKVNTVNAYGYDQYRLVGLVYTDRDMRNIVGSVSAMIDNSTSANTSLPYLYYFSGTVTSIGVVTNISEIDYLAGYFAVNGNNNWENIKPFGSHYNSETNYSIPKYEDVVRAINVFGGSHQIGFSISRKWTQEAPELYKLGLIYDIERIDNQITEEY